MSVFPKRTIRGKGVTIHWGFGALHKLGGLRFSHAKIQVKNPNGVLTTLFEKNFQILPYEKEEERISPNKMSKKSLSGVTPLLLLSDYLSGPRINKKALTSHFERLGNSRHFYFYYDIPEEAPLGKYEILSEVFIDGIGYESNTKDSDFFFVEELTISNVSSIDKGYVFEAKNHSPESCPIMIVEYFSESISKKVLNMEPLESKRITCSKDVCLFYNESRESIPITLSSKKVFRNPKFFALEKEDDGVKKIYVMDSSNNNDAYIFEDSYLEIWEKSNGSISANELKKIDEKVYLEMKNRKLIIEN